MTPAIMVILCLMSPAILGSVLALMVALFCAFRRLSREAVKGRKTDETIISAVAHAYSRSTFVIDGCFCQQLGNSVPITDEPIHAGLGGYM